MMNLTVVGDDLTGTVDCTSLGVRYGCEVRVQMDVEKDFLPPSPNKREILGVNMYSRTLSGRDAYELSKRVTKKLCKAPEQLILKKMDTGFRGNAPYEIEGMLDALGKRLCFILEHIPIRKTFTLYGHQYSGGQILSKSVFARDDLLKAPKESYIPDILAKGTNLPIGTVDIDALKGGRIVEATREQVERGKQIIVFDAITFEDGLRVVKQLQDIYPDVMWAGSTGIVEALIAYLYGDMKAGKIVAKNPRCIGFSGTAYQATKDQLKYTEEKMGLKIVDLNIDRVLDQDNSVFDEVKTECLKWNRAGMDVIVRQRLSHEKEYNGVERVIMSALCKSAQMICPHAQFDQIVIVGGETSQAILLTLGVSTLFMEDPPEIGTGVGKIGDGPYKGKSFAIKGGSIGTKNVLIKLLGKWNDI